MFKVNNKNTRTMSMTSFWCFYRQFCTYFTLQTNVSNVDFEQTNVSWVVLFQGAGTKTYLQYFFQVDETCHMGVTTNVFFTFKIQNFPEVFFHLNKTCTSSWKTDLNRRKNDFLENFLFLFYASKKVCLRLRFDSHCIIVI